MAEILILFALAAFMVIFYSFLCLVAKKPETARKIIFYCVLYGLFAEYELRHRLTRRKMEKLFNEHSAAAKKIYDYCAGFGVKILFSNVVGGQSLSHKKTGYIILNKRFLEMKMPDGLLELIAAHELAHFLLNSRSPDSALEPYRNPEFCEQEQIICLISREKAAWEETLKIFGQLNIEIDENLFWRAAAPHFATHLICFRLDRCGKFETSGCPFMIDFLASPLFKTILSYDEMERQTILSLALGKCEALMPPNVIKN